MLAEEILLPLRCRPNPGFSRLIPITAPNLCQ
jgi:hypothetical protein